MTEGELGALPDWYALVRAARYLHVAPWDLLQQPVAYLHWAITAEAAENEAQDAINKRNQPATT